MAMWSIAAAFLAYMHMYGVNCFIGVAQAVAFEQNSLPYSCATHAVYTASLVFF